MFNKIFKIIIAVIVGWLVWYAVGLLLVAMKAPAIVGTIVLILGILLVAWFIANEFGLTGGPPKT